MITNRNKKYFTERKAQRSQPTKPMKKAEDVQKSNDNRIDQDFPGFPHGQSKENIINPVSEKDKKVADVDNRDGEKINYNMPVKEEASDGSAGAFAAAEEVKE